MTITHPIATPIQHGKHAVTEAAIVSLAGRLYDRYCERVGGRAFNGDMLPKWSAFLRDPSKAKQSEAWISIAREFGACAYVAFSEECGKAFQAGVTQGRLGWVPRTELDALQGKLDTMEARYQEQRKRTTIAKAQARPAHAKRRKESF